MDAYQRTFKSRILEQLADGLPHGRPPAWTASRMDGLPHGRPPAWTASRMDGLPHGRPPAWKVSWHPV
ncbi:hypothetical protein N7513_004740 [Penicillium frequentans]|nr:hypothetical protein N7513_004740 [Penicillium glabrum]